VSNVSLDFLNGISAVIQYRKTLKRGINYFIPEEFKTIVGTSEVAMRIRIGEAP